MIQTIELDAKNRGLTRKMSVVQYDSGRVLKGIITDMVLQKGTSARFFARKPSGKVIYNNCTVEGNAVSVELTNQTLAETGILECQIETLYEGKVISSYIFQIIVERTLITDDAIESLPQSDVLDDMVKQTQEKAQEAASSAEAAEKSRQGAEKKAQEAASSAEAAEASRQGAEEKAQEAETSAEAAEASRQGAEKKAQEAETSAEAAEASRQGAEKKAQEAETSAEAAEASRQGAEEKAQEAETSAEAAESSETKAAGSASAAKTSENEAKTAKIASEAARTEAEAAREASETARDASLAAKEGAETAKAGADASKDLAEELAAEAEKWKKWAESYAHGETGVREDEGTDNGRYYLEQVRTYANSFQSALRPMGNITFERLIALESPEEGDYYNVTNEFISTENFVDGPGIQYPAGTDVYRTHSGEWNATQGSGVAGAKGGAESTYRKGLVNITKDNIGLGKVDNTADSEKKVLYADSAGTATDNTKLPLAGGSMNGDICLNSVTHHNTPKSISHYSPSYFTWKEYMNHAANDKSPTGGSEVAYGDVTGWAIRSLAESNGGMGWVWESCKNQKDADVEPKMALGAATGNLKVKGSITAPSFFGSFNGNATSANMLKEIDTRDADNPPSYYMEAGSGIITELKRGTTVGFGDKYVQVTTFTMWGDASGGFPTQIANTTNGIYYRRGVNEENWSKWINHPAILSCSNTNLDTIFSSGVYVCGSSGYASLENNFPEARKGYLLVFSSTELVNSPTAQIYITSLSKIYARIYWDGSSWGSWNAIPAAMQGATASANGTVGYVNSVPPSNGYNTKYLRADGSWQVPPDTNTKVTQNPTTANANYRVLLSAQADDTAHTDVAYKDANLTYNPNTNQLNAGSIVAKTNASTVDYTSADVADGSASTWTSVAAITSGMTHANLFNCMSTMFKNVRYLYKTLGNTNITIGDKTVTGALSLLSNAIISTNSFIDWLGLTFGVYKIGYMIQIATISGKLTSKLNAYESYTVGTLQEVHRPKKEISKNIIILEGVQARLSIAVAGTVQLTPFSAVQSGYTPLINEIFF